MVGVARRSKACHTCRKRRIKCGGERPKCQNCVNSRRFCTGYQRSHTFVQAKEMELLESVNPVKELPRSTEGADTSTIVVTRWKTKVEEPPTLVVRQESGSNATLPADQQCSEFVGRLRVVNGISLLPAFRDQFLGVFIQTHVPAVRYAQPGPHNRFSHRNFFLLLPYLPNVGPALEYCILAVCTSRVGRIDRRSDLMFRSRDLYTKSLYELQRAVLNPLTRLDDQTLSATVLLIMYEFVECPGEEVRGYAAHLQGALKLLRLRGPEAHTFGFGHALLFILRKLAFYDSLLCRSPSFLSSPEWQNIPYRSRSKNSHDFLFDLLEQLPILLSESNAVRAETTSQGILSRALRATQLAWRINNSLTVWLERFEASIVGPLYVPVFSRLPHSPDDPIRTSPFPVSFTFSHFAIAQVMGLYWTAVVILYTFFRGTYTQLELISGATAKAEVDALPCSCTGSDSDVVMVDMGSQGTVEARDCVRHFGIEMLPPLGHRAEPWVMADNVCQSVEYFLNMDSGYVGTTMILPMLMAVRQCQPFWGVDTSREQAWIDEMIKRMANAGNRMVSHVEGYYKE